MRSPHCVFRDRFIALSICFCAVLAFSAPLRADVYQFVPGKGVPGLSYLGWSGIGPYGGTLTDTTTGVTSPNSIFFCLTGNQQYGSTETDGPGGQASLAPSTVGQEEAAFLYSLMLSDEVTRGVTLSTTGTGNYKTVVVNGSPSAVAAFEGDLGPIQMAIWYVMHTLPGALAGQWQNYSDGNNHDFSNILDTATRNDVKLAYAGYSAFANSPEFQIFLTADGTGQNFIGAVPEPGTMVLFGAGVLLMGLGCARRRLARRAR